MSPAAIQLGSIKLSDESDPQELLTFGIGKHLEIRTFISKYGQLAHLE